MVRDRFTDWKRDSEGERGGGDNLSDVPEKNERSVLCSVKSGRDEIHSGRAAVAVNSRTVHSQRLPTSHLSRWSVGGWTDRRGRAESNRLTGSTQFRIACAVKSLSASRCSSPAVRKHLHPRLRLSTKSSPSLPFGSGSQSYFSPCRRVFPTARSVSRGVKRGTVSVIPLFLFQQSLCLVLRVRARILECTPLQSRV